jgi:hypothetical protein
VNAIELFACVTDSQSAIGRSTFVSMRFRVAPASQS